MSIPTSALSDAFQKHLKNRRPLQLAFLTYTFEPAFFEQEIVPTFVDVTSSSNERLRILMLTDALRGRTDVAVYFDPSALKSSDGTSRLPIHRIPVRVRQGVFHPKSVLALVEDTDPDPDLGRPRQHLIVGMTSANATRAGWWENVEAAHIESVSEGARSPLVEGIRKLIDGVIEACDDARETHVVLRKIRTFLTRVDPDERRTKDGVLASRVYSSGSTSLLDFLGDKLKSDATGLNLEIISPYFDEADASILAALVKRFKPRETRLLLPRDPQGGALCSEPFFASVKAIEGVHWSRLPSAIMSGGSAANARQRFVHAKVYRFFDDSRRTEFLFIGSPNLTTPAHSGHANFEAGILIDAQPQRVPEWWTVRDSKEPSTFAAKPNEESAAGASALTALSVRFNWTTRTAEARWDSDARSPALSLEIQAAAIQVAPLPAREWIRLSDEDAAALQARLGQTSFLRVGAEGLAPAFILVIEEGMEAKPSIVLELTAAEILKYWALLTPEQRAAFLGERLDADDLTSTDRERLRRKQAQDANSMFGTFAAIFQSFAALEQHLMEAVAAANSALLRARLFTENYDSLPVLLRRVMVELEKDKDSVKAYVTFLCARQMLEAVGNELGPEHELVTEIRRLRTQLREQSDSIRDGIDVGGPEQSEPFFKWFETWFLKRAEVKEAA